MDEVVLFRLRKPSLYAPIILTCGRIPLEKIEKPEIRLPCSTGMIATSIDFSSRSISRAIVPYPEMISGSSMGLIYV